MDTNGALWLVTLAIVLGLNQVAVKFTNNGLQPIFWAGLRSAFAALCIAIWLQIDGKYVRFNRSNLLSGFLAGLVFALEFLFLFLALDLTTVVRASVLLYSMPVWLTIGAHLLIPHERTTPTKIIGLSLAILGVCIAMFGQNQTGMNSSLIGDLCALAAAIFWACIPICTRLTNLSEVEPEMQLMWMVLVSVPILWLFSLFFGPAIRSFTIILVPIMMFQVIVVVTGGFLLWLHMLRKYSADNVASFSFLSPVFGVFFGWLLLGENVGIELFFALVLVSAGIILINKPNRKLS